MKGEASENRTNIRFLKLQEDYPCHLSVGSSPKELANKVKSEIALWGKVIKDSGIREDE